MLGSSPSKFRDDNPETTRPKRSRPGAAPAFDTFARSQTCAPRSKTEAMMLAQERRDLAAVCGRDQVSTVMALNPGDATLFDKRFRKSMEKRGLYF